MRIDVLKTQKEQCSFSLRVWKYNRVCVYIRCVCIVCLCGGVGGGGVFLSTCARYSLNLSVSLFMASELILLLWIHSNSYLKNLNSKTVLLKIQVFRDVTLWPQNNVPEYMKHYNIFFSGRTSSYNSGQWPTWCAISSIICLFESSTCFEQLCAHPQEDNCINTTSGIITVC